MQLLSKNGRRLMQRRISTHKKIAINKSNYTKTTKKFMTK